MLTIDIQEKVTSYEMMALLLQEISRQLVAGYTSGFYPTWSTSGDEELYVEENPP
jgi:hypothetical protein